MKSPFPGAWDRLVYLNIYPRDSWEKPVNIDHVSQNGVIQAQLYVWVCLDSGLLYMIFFYLMKKITSPTAAILLPHASRRKSCKSSTWKRKNYLCSHCALETQPVSQSPCVLGLVQTQNKNAVPAPRTYSLSVQDKAGERAKANS